MIKLINVGYYTLKNLTLTEKTRLLTGDGYWTSVALKDAGIPSIRFSDGPAGLRSQGGKGDNLGENKSFPATCFPAHSALACSWNKNLCAVTGKSIGEEAVSFGTDILLAPDLNIKRDPFNGRNFEYFSEDPYLNGKLGAAYASGVQSAGAGACLKHFAANNREFARMVCNSVVDERTLREIYLTGFEIAVKESKPAAVMTAYNMLNGVYCNENSHLLREILRGEWGFEGITVSDWGGTSSRPAAVRAGGDLEMPSCKFSAGEVEEAISRGELGESAIDASVVRIVKFARRKRSFENHDVFGAHGYFAETCAEECAVLLKNDGALPLRETDKIALIGGAAVNPIIQGGGSSKVNPEYTYSLLECMTDKISGFESGKSEKRALKLCASADTVIFCAGHDGDREGCDRETLSLPEKQVALLKKITKLKKRVIVVLFCGSAVDTEWDKDVNALLFAGLGGQAGARAVANILTGRVCPSGKLAETFPLSAEKPEKDPYCEVYSEGMRVGYRSGKAAKYPFGFGLSYAKFVYSNLYINEKGAAFDLTNVGAVRGAEAVQLYVRFPDGANAPFKQLKGFDKILLSPGEARQVFIPFDEYTFRAYDAIKNKWVKVAGKYEIMIGASSEDIRLSRHIETAGDSAFVPAPDVSSLKPAEYPVQRDGKGRVIADRHTPLCELKNAKGRFGRCFARFALWVVRNKKTVHGSMEYLPLRALGQFGKFGKNRLDGFILMCNGKLFKGLRLFSKR